MKKIISLMLSILLIAVLSGCGGTQNTAGESVKDKRKKEKFKEL